MKLSSETDQRRGQGHSLFAKRVLTVFVHRYYRLGRDQEGDALAERTSGGTEEQRKADENFHDSTLFQVSSCGDSKPASTLARPCATETLVLNDTASLLGVVAHVSHQVICERESGRLGGPGGENEDPHRLPSSGLRPASLSNPCAFREEDAPGGVLEREEARSVEFLSRKVSANLVGLDSACQLPVERVGLDLRKEVAFSVEDLDPSENAVLAVGAALGVDRRRPAAAVDTVRPLQGEESLSERVVAGRTKVLWPDERLDVAFLETQRFLRGELVPRVLSQCRSWMGLPETGLPSSFLLL